MKIFLIRPGESFDDIYREFGSWSTRGLTPTGIKTAFDIANKLKIMDGKYGIILSSPVPRALQTAEIIASELGVKMEEEPYAKERNTYGLLAGVNEDSAAEEYPEMNAAYLAGRYIPGSERYQDCVERVRRLVERMEVSENKSVICVTHGHIMTIIIEEMLGMVRNSIKKGAILETEINNGKMELVHADGVSFSTDENVIKDVEKRKFKKD